MAADEEVGEIRWQAVIDLGQAEDPGPGVARAARLRNDLPVSRGSGDRQLRHLLEVADPDAGTLGSEVGRRVTGEGDRDAADEETGGESPGEPLHDPAEALGPESEIERRCSEERQDRLVVGPGDDRGPRPGGPAGGVPEGAQEATPAARRHGSRGGSESEIEAARDRGHAEHFGVDPEGVGESVREQEEAGRKEQRQTVRIEAPQIEGAEPDREHQQRHVHGEKAVGAEQGDRRRREERHQVRFAEEDRFPVVVGHQDEVLRLDVRKFVRQALDVLRLATQIEVVNQG